MTPPNNLYVQDRRYGRRKRPPRRNPQRVLLAVALGLVVLTAAVTLYRFLPGLLDGGDPTGTSQTATATTGTKTTTSSQTETTTQTPVTPTPTLTPEYVNPQLLPINELAVQSAGIPAEGCSPAERGIVATILDSQSMKLASFQRPDVISLLHPAQYASISGVLTFRGNNFRNAPSFGLVSLAEKQLEQKWTRPVGSLHSSAWDFTWTGTGWTGQPLLVQWDDDVRKLMNINDDKKQKENLVEVIYATMDGNIYFFDLDDGVPTRPPIKVGAPIKGTPCVDPRGYPVLYVGQGDKNSKVDGIGFRVFNLVDQSLLLYKECSDASSYRENWGACDSSPIFDAAADTLIYPNENGMIYTARMNTEFNRQNGQLKINPVFTTYRYKMTGLKNFGIESSLAVYDGYGYYSDNSGILNCIDLNSLQPVWSRQLEDDSDVTPVLAQNGSQVALYTGTEVDWQQSIIGNYQGKSFIYKIDAMTGKIIWEATYDCWTKNAADFGDDVNGGAMGTPVVGKQKLQDLVIFSFCMTNGIYSGNSVIAYNQNDGKVVWEYKMDNYSWSSPIDVYDKAGNGYILIPDSIGQLHLLDGRTGKALDVLQLTRNKDAEKAGNIESSCAVFGNRLVIGTRGNVIVSVELK